VLKQPASKYANEFSIIKIAEGLRVNFVFCTGERRSVCELWWEECWNSGLCWCTEAQCGNIQDVCSLFCLL